MAEILLTFVLVCILMLAMSIGVLAGRKPIAGSCGGLNGAADCEICGGDVSRCRGD